MLSPNEFERQHKAKPTASRKLGAVQTSTANTTFSLMFRVLKPFRERLVGEPQ